MMRLRFDFADRALFVRLFGADVYAVGGTVRDLVRGCPSPDVDILVARHGLEEIVRKLERHGRVDLVGKSFGIIKFTVRGKTYDVALPRTDRASASGAGVRGHKDIIVSADPDLPVEKDLARRDFRTNSMALRLKDGTLIDPFEGRKDTLARRIRLTDPAAFPEDPLRVLRVARFASVLGFKADPAIYPIARAVDLSGLSSERVHDELVKILLRSPRPSIGLEEMFRLGVLEAWYPELQALALIIQDSVFHPERDAFGHHTVWAHTKLAVDQAAALAGQAGLPDPRKLALLLATLFHDLGKVSTTRWEYKRGRMAVTSCGHDIQSEKAARKVLTRFRIQTWNGFNLGRIVPLLIRTHHRAGELWQNRAGVTKKAFNRLAADVEGEIELLVMLDAADRAGRGTRLVRGLDRTARWLFKRFEELEVNRETIKPLVMGRDLLALGVRPGPDMGRLLKKLYKAQLDGLFETKARGVEKARRIVERKAR
ncbi:MAG: CCA tRNA nucleotidyltransferase [Candidatus Aminicenantes bacterium]|nr:CCA tRNA nucleotidyltransferase [Candidatus Aminicenantes bacterium]